MQSLVLSKTPYGERHLICDLLYQNGTRKKAIFYGGRGGGKSSKPSKLELGHRLQHPKVTREKEGGLVSLSEWELTWNHNHIAGNHRAYFLLSFVCELLRSISDDYGEQSEDKLYNLLSNAVFFMEEDLVAKKFDANVHLGLFLVKLTYYSGIFPNLETCHFCGSALSLQNVEGFLANEGSFSCQCDSVTTREIIDGQKVLYSLYQLYGATTYRNRTQLTPVASNALKMALRYFLGQFHLSQESLKSYKFIF